MKIKITHDVYNIANRLRNIDSGYYIMYDTSKKCYEVHNKNQYDSTYCLTLPFLELDERTINYVNKTKRENLEYLLDEIEKDNSIVESEQKSAALHLFNNSLEKLLKEV